MSITWRRAIQSIDENPARAFGRGCSRSLLCFDLNVFTYFQDLDQCTNHHSYKGSIWPSRNKDTLPNSALQTHSFKGLIRCTTLFEGTCHHCSLPIQIISCRQGDVCMHVFLPHLNWQIHISVATWLHASPCQPHMHERCAATTVRFCFEAKKIEYAVRAFNEEMQYDYIIATRASLGL